MGISKIPQRSIAKVSDKFSGQWNVREFVFAANGSYLGSINQKRQVEALDANHLTVTQWCKPDANLEALPIGRFQGRFSFILNRQRHFREYQGPDVRGWGINFGDRFLSGQGFWPNFGFNFESWSTLITPSKQLTGGVFYRGKETIAVIIGIGGPVSTTSDTSDSLNICDFPASAWFKPTIKQSFECQGQTSTHHHESGQDNTISVKRTFTTNAEETTWTDHQQKRSTIHKIKDHSYIYIDGVRGTYKQYGPSIHWEVYTSDYEHIKGLDLYIQDQHLMLSIKHHYQFQNLKTIEGSLYKLEDGNKL